MSFSQYSHLHPVRRPAISNLRGDGDRKERLTPSREDSARFLAHAAQNITSGANDLIDFTLRCQSLDDLEPVLLTVKELRERIDAIATRALQRMDELCEWGRD